MALVTAVLLVSAIVTACETESDGNIQYLEINKLLGSKLFKNFNTCFVCSKEPSY